MGKSGLPNIKITKYVLPYFFQISLKSVSFVGSLKINSLLKYKNV